MVSFSMARPKLNRFFETDSSTVRFGLIQDLVMTA